MKNLKIRELTQIALFTALIAVIAPFALNVGPVPISLATLIIYIAAGVLGGYKGTVAVLVYILLGACGVPVFSNWGAGIQKIIGPTGGYIIGYLPLAFLSGLFSDGVQTLKNGSAPKTFREFLTIWRFPAGMLLGTVVLYAIGTAWFMYAMDKTLAESLIMCVVPFIPGDAIKIAAATAVSPALKLAVNRYKAKNI